MAIGLQDPPAQEFADDDDDLNNDSATVVDSDSALQAAKLELAMQGFASTARAAHQRIASRSSLAGSVNGNGNPSIRTDSLVAETVPDASPEARAYAASKLRQPRYRAFVVAGGAALLLLIANLAGMFDSLKEKPTAKRHEPPKGGAITAKDDGDTRTEDVGVGGGSDGDTRQVAAVVGADTELPTVDGADVVPVPPESGDGQDGQEQSDEHEPDPPLTEAEKYLQALQEKLDTLATTADGGLKPVEGKPNTFEFTGLGITVGPDGLEGEGVKDLSEKERKIVVGVSDDKMGERTLAYKFALPSKVAKEFQNDFTVHGIETRNIVDGDDQWVLVYIDEVTGEAISFLAGVWQSGYVNVSVDGSDIPIGVPISYPATGNDKLQPDHHVWHIGGVPEAAKVINRFKNISSVTTDIPDHMRTYKGGPVTKKGHQRQFNTMRTALQKHAADADDSRSIAH